MTLLANPNQKNLSRLQLNVSNHRLLAQSGSHTLVKLAPAFWRGATVDFRDKTIITGYSRAVRGHGKI